MIIRSAYGKPFLAIVDTAEEREDFEAHTKYLEVECPECGKSVSELHDRCPRCKLRFVFLGSPHWKKRYGAGHTPDKVAQEIEREPQGELERIILGVLGCQTWTSDLRLLRKVRAGHWTLTPMTLNTIIPGVMEKVHHNRKAAQTYLLRQFGVVGNEEDTQDDEKYTGDF